MSTKKIAVCYTVKDEARLLPHAVKYHLAAGVSRIYVFLDGTTDNSRELIEDVIGVEVHRSAPPTGGVDEPGWFGGVGLIWEGNFDARKRVNTFRAAQWAHAAGIEWLASIDPDELIIANSNDLVSIDLMDRLLRCVPENIDQILLRNLELVPVVSESVNPFLDNVYFLNRFPRTELVFRYSSALARRLLRNSRLHAWFEHLFYKLRFLGTWPRLMRHPATKSLIPSSYFLGYVNHKAIIRTNASDKYNFNIHRWGAFLSKPKSI